MNRENVAQSFQWYQPIDVDNRLQDSTDGTVLLRAKQVNMRSRKTRTRYK
jgi:hypothetical protein